MALLEDLFASADGRGDDFLTGLMRRSGADVSRANAQRNAPYVREGAHDYNTQLSPEDEIRFRAWLKQNNVPFNPSAEVSDYDMRGFWKGLQDGNPKAQSAIDPNDNRLHYPDNWKTPYHETFSNESQWSKDVAPRWNDVDQLVTPGGRVQFDDRAPRSGPLGLGSQDLDLLLQALKGGGR